MLPKSADSETSLACATRSVPSRPCDVHRYVTCHVRCYVVDSVDFRAVFDVLHFLALFKLKLLSNDRQIPVLQGPL